ncbi:7tm 6 domain containing protein [Asbolus verrucosus]|uniref:7tm 6 domain containing protein n=1 Tax=Asbolus verrucosus TaxID=1661398 RepID=A0A482VSJ9_ASBVE|nr:7tm 6 domain containing protein [Asbolus verrucosus]
MEKYDWKLTINTNILKLKFIGLWPDDESYKADLYTLWTTISLTVFVCGHNFFQAANLIFNINDLQTIAATSFITLSTLIAILKAYYVIQNMGILKELMVTLNSDLFQPKNLRQINQIKPSLKFWKINYILYWSMAFAENCNNFFNWIVFGQFFISATSIGITMFQLTMVDSQSFHQLRHSKNTFQQVVPFSSEFFSLVSFGLAIIVEIFMYCWFGNEVEVKSSNVPIAAFESNWIDASIEVKKNMFFFILRCQTPLKMSALNLFYLSLDTFMRILRAAWSYFALLHQDRRNH